MLLKRITRWFRRRTIDLLDIVLGAIPRREPQNLQRLDNSPLNELLRVALHNTLKVKRTQPPTYNWKRLSNGTYVVRTQAGLRQAIKNFVGTDGDRRCQRGWPTAYPAVCRIAHCHGGVQIKALTVGEYRKQTQALLDELAGD